MLVIAFVSRNEQMHLIKICISMTEKYTKNRYIFIKLTLLLKTFFFCDLKDVSKMFINTITIENYCCYYCY